MWLGGVQPGDLPGTTVTRGDRCCAQGLQAVGLTRSREAAKGNAVVGFRCSVRRAADGSPRVRRRLRCSAVPGVGLWQCVGECVAPSPPTPLPRFTGARGALRSWGFPARDLPSATGCLQVAAAGRGGSGWAHAKPRSRERKRSSWFSVFGQASRGRESAGEAAVALHCRAGVGLWQCVGECVAPSPPTPLPRFTGARGAVWVSRGGLRRRSGSSCRA
jgi:hypothetical protein